jgi:hypothetical protein
MQHGSAKIIIIALVILAIGGGAYYFTSLRESNLPTPPEPPTTQPPAEPLSVGIPAAETGGTTGQTLAPEDTIRSDITAQNSQNWPSFLSLRTKISGPPESRVDWIKYREAYPENDLLANITSARLVELKPIPVNLDLVGVYTKKSELLGVYDELKVYYVGIDYRVKEEKNGFYTGVNYRLYLLTPEDEQWVIVEASVAPVDQIIKAGYGFGTPEETTTLQKK